MMKIFGIIGGSVMESNLTTLFTLYSEQDAAPIIELQDINHKPVGALYLNRFRDKSKFVITETNNAERYYFYCDGVAIFFSFWKKLSSE
jgi:hypothetical protein